MIEFAWPACFILLLLPLLFRKAASEISTADVPFISVSHRYKSAGLTLSHSHKTNQRQKHFVFWIMWLFLVVAATRPQHVGQPVTLPTEGRDLLLAVDISPSMKERDMIIGNSQVTRLEAVKKVVSDFIRQRKGDRVGLILFGSEPYIQAPLTFDSQTVELLLNEAQLGMAGKATAIGDAIGLAVKRLRDRPAESRVLVLLTDGANTAGEVQPLQAAELASKEGIKIYTIGIGAEEMLQQSFFGTRRVNPSMDLDEAMLKKIAEKTQGQFFRARNTPELEMVYEAVNTLEPIEQDAKTWRPISELYFWPLGAAFVIMLFSVILRLAVSRHSLSVGRR
ncbi:MAG: VWA domain-containing protein [Hahellaceae bacterium]|nr:VWA domain-containing protein [Hahellaceae bacterium]